MAEIKAPWLQSAALSSDFYSIRYISDQECHHIASVSSGFDPINGNEFGQDEALAHANMIAAAPEMAIEIAKQIDWLKHARAECAGSVRGSLLNGFDQSIKYLTAVLAKANGEKV